MQYGGEPVSWFQKKIRGNMMVLNDHISKEMNELNLIRWGASTFRNDQVVTGMTYQTRR